MPSLDSWVRAHEIINQHLIEMLFVGGHILFMQRMIRVGMQSFRIVKLNEETDLVVLNGNRRALSRGLAGSNSTNGRNLRQGLLGVGNQSIRFIRRGVFLQIKENRMNKRRRLQGNDSPVSPALTL